MQRPLQLPDRQILMGDQRRIIQCLGPGDRQFGLDQRSARSLVFGSGQRRGQGRALCRWAVFIAARQLQRAAVRVQSTSRVGFGDRQGIVVIQAAGAA
ncbi:hypothetical protein [Mesorhizobium sp.]|uniref:hypothetical protein n=1 Tax=Mesorhizobium sp. TaxID=1871066 RepID=UPI00257A261A|nr:hypothetical protein [Mesorhizobium sp.]